LTDGNSTFHADEMSCEVTMKASAHPFPQTKPELDDAIGDPRTYANEALYHAIFSHLRREAPVYWCEPRGMRPFWMLSKHADICAVETDGETYLNEPRLMLFSEEDEDRIRAFTGGSLHLSRHLLNMDGPDHRLFRGMTQSWFGPKSIRTLEQQIRDLARESVDHMASLGGACDFVTDVALWYPLRVIMRILGLPREDEAFLMKITQEVFGPNDPDNSRPLGAEGVIEALGEFSAYCDALIADRRRHPRDDVSTVIANVTMPDGQPIGNLEAMSYFLIIATAGHDTTSSSSAAGLLELIRNPSELAKIRENPALAGSMVDEFVRWSSPVKHFFRTATRDVSIRGVPVAAGQNVMLCYPSANRDEDIFEEPFRFLIDRKPARHVAFGYGAHLCLGQHLAKLEIRILFEELLARFRDFSLDGTPAYTNSSFVSGLKRLTIRYRLA
jgi:cytochrome P450